VREKTAAVPKDNILIIEDEENIVELVRYNLEEQGYSVKACNRGDEGLEMARKELPSLILLDLMLPEINGLDICRCLKQDPKTSQILIVMLTAKGEEMDRVLGLELGADDYVTKPFSPRELMARVKAVLRRHNAPAPLGGLLKHGALELDTERHVVKLKGRVVEFTSKEYELLKALMEADGRVLTRDQLLSQVWGYDESLNIETRTIDMHIGQLRKKIKTEADSLVTVKNVGYRFDRKP